LHSLLVYETGQFFALHQDSEKADDMVGTLVVSLPSFFKGGSLVVRHRGEKVTYRPSKKKLSLIAFYADCKHEVLPVKEGYRVALTYNLVLDGDSFVTPLVEVNPEAVASLTEALRSYFAVPRSPRYSWRKDDPPRTPPERLVFLLDHEYTQAGLAWGRLKGDDAVRATVLKAAGEDLDCELALALAEIHETWDCGADEDWYGRRGRWGGYEEQEEEDPGDYQLVDLMDSETTLNAWIAPGGKKVEPISTDVEDGEVCYATASMDLASYSSEYEGYMGNYGNTMDRWYRRAAILVWPRKHAFSVRSEISPAWGLGLLKERLRKGDLDEAREVARSMLSVWDRTAREERRRGFFDTSLRISHDLDSPELATSLMTPFEVEALTPGRASKVVALLTRYGATWLQELLALWSEFRRDQPHRCRKDPKQWATTLPEMIQALCQVDGNAGKKASGLLLEDRWTWLKGELEATCRLGRTSLVEQRLKELSGPLFSFLSGVEIGGTKSFLAQVMKYLCAKDNERLFPCLLESLRVAGSFSSGEKGLPPHLEKLRRYCLRVLKRGLRVRPRGENDWSMELPAGCSCELCSTLAEFLSDPDLKQLDWPLAAQRRRHIHGRIDHHELPVRHSTRRKGSPYVLVLTKTRELFTWEVAIRRSHEVDVDWLETIGNE
jgi:hypothetical protein